MKPLLSIVIATKNRVPYCINAIETILSFPNENFELVIQDNTDNLDLNDYVKSNISDCRLVYSYTPPPFSSIDNFNAAFELANGEYVCFIGDDDGINPNIFRIVEWGKLNNLDSICPKVFVDYYWPNAFYNLSEGYLTIPYFSMKICVNDPSKEISPLVKDCFENYTKFKLPKLYHGVIKKECLNTMKEKTGYYVGGLSPDIYLAVALSQYVKRQVIIDYPLTISGACNGSASVSGQTGGHSGSLKDAPHFRDRGKYEWHKMVPKFYSVKTIWAETALKAIDEHKITCNLNDFSLTRLVSLAIVDDLRFFRFYLHKSYPIVKYKYVFISKIIINVTFLGILKLFKKTKNKILAKFFHKIIRFNNVKNIQEATKILKSLPINNNIDLILDLKLPKL